MAATKSYITSLSAVARLVAHWQADDALLAALANLPQRLTEATRQDWTPAVDALRDAERIMVVGRGLGFAVALEAALKFKETCAIQAEAFSGAEIKHGPMALIDDGYPLLIFAPRGPEQQGLIDLAEEMRGRGAKVLLAAPENIVSRDLTLALADDESVGSFAGDSELLSDGGALVRGARPESGRAASSVQGDLHALSPATLETAP
ncbi:SIS domain-containing protein [Chromobacterium haemolyticum]|nr:SIS domain-containing protein [Chromobacterium haemolyticum]